MNSHETCAPNWVCGVEPPGTRIRTITAVLPSGETGVVFTAMQQFQEYLRKRLAERVKQRRVVVWYDSRGDFIPFVEDLGVPQPGEPTALPALCPVVLDGATVDFVRYDGSYFALRAAVEPLVQGDTPACLVVYLPGVERDPKGSVLMELELGGDLYQPRLKSLARSVLREKYGDARTDELLASDHIGYRMIERLLAEEDSGPGAILRVLLGSQSADGILCRWLAQDAHDTAIEEKGARADLWRLIRMGLGLELPADLAMARARTRVARHVLVGEFRADLQCDAPAVLSTIPAPSTSDQVRKVHDVAARLRQEYGEAYRRMADEIEAELRLAATDIPAEALGSIDTFRFEERRLLAHCGALIVEGKYQDALEIVAKRQESFWLLSEAGRKAQWEACRLMAELGKATGVVNGELRKSRSSVAAWIDAYTRDEGWYLLDQAQRHLEAWVARIDEDPEAERALGCVRRAHEDTIAKMAEGFGRALELEQWSVADFLPQTRIYPDVHLLKRPVAYIIVDAMRYEMGAELADRLSSAEELALQPAVAVLPTITPMGMAALLPGAATSFDVVEEGGRLGARVDGNFLPDLAARRRHFQARARGYVEMTLDDLLGMTQARLKQKVQGQRVILVRSQEIDAAGEGGFSFAARNLMDTVIDNLVRAIRKLAVAGVTDSKVTADHGHLFGLERDESMRVDAPGGDTVELHRRCWIGRGGATPTGCVRIGGAALGYRTDLEFVFPRGTAVFRSGGDLAYHHGGLTLQEMLVPVLAVRMKATAGRERAEQRVLEVSRVPATITNRFFSVEIQVTEMLGRTVRPVLMAGSQQVGTAGMAMGAQFDQGAVVLEPGRAATVGLMLRNDQVDKVRLVVSDAETDLVLYQSEDIPVKLGV